MQLCINRTGLYPVEYGWIIIFSLGAKNNPRLLYFFISIYYFENHSKHHLYYEKLQARVFELYLHDRLFYLSACQKTKICPGPKCSLKDKTNLINQTITPTSDLYTHATVAFPHDFSEHEFVCWINHCGSEKAKRNPKNLEKNNVLYTKYIKLDGTLVLSWTQTIDPVFLFVSQKRTVTLTSALVIMAVFQITAESSFLDEIFTKSLLNL